MRSFRITIVHHIETVYCALIIIYSFGEFHIFILNEFFHVKLIIIYFEITNLFESVCCVSENFFLYSKASKVNDTIMVRSYPPDCYSLLYQED